MKDLVSQKHTGSFSELIKVIKEMWAKKISGEYCKSLIYSMPRQLQAVIDARGDTQSMYLYNKYNNIHVSFLFLGYNCAPPRALAQNFLKLEWPYSC